ncbi:DUF2798 domain-containing protein [Ignatzschineria rhizosphaerae]|uniref:DUF2798 domain-containing protein n=1 Tax=Ignatzschineria rhizosphaerae TaxID=2923279 RepID=A0ABY3X5S1_9GAMM|nr:DUF2798 domain-containing protein [Ignatzschineria rhizosphaerae]UNM96135.1 DUF2798 domain-containing protein [Ignatzschineria rhizosphaerae]
MLERYKFHPRMLHILVPFFLSLSMSCIVSCVSTLMNVGFSGFIFSTWCATWMFSWAVAFPSVLILLPIVRRFAKIFVRSTP